jgi:hypothetical protein
VRPATAGRQGRGRPRYGRRLVVEMYALVLLPPSAGGARQTGACRCEEPDTGTANQPAVLVAHAVTNDLNQNHRQAPDSQVT